MTTSYTVTSESVAAGHPDKLCDYVSDTIVDLFLAQDAEARVAVEALATQNRLVLAGEVRGPQAITAEIVIKAARDAVKFLGYDQENFDWRTLDIACFIHGQSSDIAQGVDAGATKAEGAGDQGIMFGYACDETNVYMPAPLFYAHRLMQGLAEARRSGEVSGLLPDAKCQISLAYINGIPVGAQAIVLSTQHEGHLSQADVRALVMPLIQRILPEGWVTKETVIHINPTGRFVIGGPAGDTGLTGRKIIVDTYGGAAPHGGGAFSGKDPTKVDRSAAYIARYLAKNIVAAQLACKCVIQIAYAIGVAQPVALYVKLDQVYQAGDSPLVRFLRERIDMSPRGIRTLLGLNKPIYRPTASFGHFGRDPTPEGHFSWEKLDLVDELKKFL
jgi:S-adenosylmethionine synthetase